MNRKNIKLVRGIKPFPRIVPATEDYDRPLNPYAHAAETAAEYLTRKSAAAVAVAGCLADFPLAGFPGEAVGYEIKRYLPRTSPALHETVAARELAAWDELLGPLPKGWSRKPREQSSLAVPVPGQNEGVTLPISKVLLSIPDPRVREVVAMVSRHRGVTTEEALATGKPTLALQIISYMLRYGCEYEISGIARAVGRTKDEVTDMIAQLGARMRRESKLHEAVELVAGWLGILCMTLDSAASTPSAPAPDPLPAPEPVLRTWEEVLASAKGWLEAQVSCLAATGTSHAKWQRRLEIVSELYPGKAREPDEVAWDGLLEALWDALGREVDAAVDGLEGLSVPSEAYDRQERITEGLFECFDELKRLGPRPQKRTAA